MAKETAIEDATEVTQPLGAQTMINDGDGDGDDMPTNLGDIAPGICDQPGR